MSMTMSMTMSTISAGGARGGSAAAVPGRTVAIGHCIPPSKSNASFKMARITRQTTTARRRGSSSSSSSRTTTSAGASGAVFSGGGGGNDDSGNKGSGGGPGGGSGSGSGSGSGAGGGGSGLIGYLVDGWRRRTAADPEFAFKLLTEQILGVLLGCVGDMVTRPNYGLGELDFVLAFAVIASIVNFSLVWALAPVATSNATAAIAGATASSKGFNLIPSALTKGCPQSHMFERGSYSIMQRLRTFLAKTITFGLIGGAGGASGALVTLGLIEARKKLNPKSKTESKDIKIVTTTGAWMLHVGISSNLRYNILNGTDMILAPMMPSSVFKAYSVIIRSANNVVGGTSAAICQKITGAQ